MHPYHCHIWTHTRVFQGAELVRGTPFETLLTGQTISLALQPEYAVVNAYGSQAQVAEAEVPACQVIYYKLIRAETSLVEPCTAAYACLLSP